MLVVKNIKKLHGQIDDSVCKRQINFVPCKLPIRLCNDIKNSLDIATTVLQYFLK